MNAATINQQRVMQVATVSGEQPWICTVYFVVCQGCFYWLSIPERRHSRELTKNKKAAIAIAIKQDKPVVGVQAEGDVSVVSDDDEMALVLEMYIKKYNQGSQFIEAFKAGKNQHMLYKLMPRKVMCFDELDHSEALYQEIILT